MAKKQKADAGAEPEAEAAADVKVFAAQPAPAAVDVSGDPSVAEAQSEVNAALVAVAQALERSRVPTFVPAEAEESKRLRAAREKLAKAQRAAREAAADSK